MEQESFENHKVAEALNQIFICIKVDREERPDIDAVYMKACQSMTGSGGWPLTIVMTADQKPFFAGTYLPPKSRGGMMGVLELTSAIAREWSENRDAMETAGEEIYTYLRQLSVSKSAPADPDKALLKLALGQYRSGFDPVYGGFNPAPKFPAPHNILYLLRYAAVENDAVCQNMAVKTLSQMYKGGIFDHIGGGFSRYSTDNKWLIPHFEKMLYDNALLTLAYAEAYHMERRPLWERIIRKTLDYVMRELRDLNGGFYCAQDADSEGIEGKYYGFTPAEIDGVLGKANSRLFCRWFDITATGNFEGKSIPNLLSNPDWEQENQNIDELCQQLYAYRLGRTSLHKDDKILTAWNALMIAAFAKASFVLKEHTYLQVAEQAHDFISENLMKREYLFVRWRDGESAHSGQLDDYAFYSFALLALYESTFKPLYLQECKQIADQMLRLFFDNINGGFYIYSEEGETLIDRPKEVYDGAMPSGNSVAASVLVRLSRLTGEQKWQEASDTQLRFLSGAIRSFPMAHSASLLAMLETLYPSSELLCITAENEVPSSLFDFLAGQYFQNLSVLVKTPDNASLLAACAPFTKHYPIPENGTAFYLCQNGACAKPVYRIEDLRELIIRL